MTLISRDQMPARTPYEAELRERLERAEQRAATYLRLAALQEAIVIAARNVMTSMLAPPTEPLRALDEALRLFDREAGTILLESMPAELREAITGPSASEEALREQTEPLFQGLGDPPAGVISDTVAVCDPPSPGLPTLDLDGLERDLGAAGPLEVTMLAGQGWPAGWEEITGIADQEIVWPVQPKGEPAPGGSPIAAFATHEEQRLYFRLRNAAPVLLAVARAAAALADVSVPHYRWCRKPHYGSECTCQATSTNDRLDALRRAMRGGGG